MVSLLRGLIDEAVRDGFQGLCATGDMRWELGDDKNFDRLLEYEALLEQVFVDKPLSGVCQYHRHTVPARCLQDALLAHRSLYIGSSLNMDNLFYVPPEFLLNSRDPAVRDMQGEWMSQQITRVMQAERRRDDALKALSASEAEQRHLAAQLAKANRELEARVRERTLELEGANRELESFSYSVSHDLRAPLRSIDGFSLAVLEDEGARLTPEGKGNLERVRAATSRMGLLIEDMLTLSRVTRKEFQREEVDLSGIAREAVQDLRRQSPARAADVTIQDGLTASGDPDLLRAVLTNLLGNAWKFTAKVKAAAIEFGRRRDPEKGEVFFIRDNGAGFDMAYAHKLFGVFQRLHGQEEFPGTGVGLASVQKIIRRHGGEVWAEGEVGKGATFFFTLGGEKKS
jgi:signal transduction histidine kinase